MCTHREMEWSGGVTSKLRTLLLVYVTHDGTNADRTILQAKPSNTCTTLLVTGMSACLASSPIYTGKLIPTSSHTTLQEEHNVTRQHSSVPTVDLCEYYGGDLSTIKAVNSSCS